MGYLKCEKCGGYYELQKGESPNDFETCECGGKLKNIERLSDIKPDKKDVKKPVQNTAPKTKAPSSSPKPKRKKYLLIGLVVVVIAIVLVGGYYAYGYYQNQKFEDNFKLHYQAVTNGNNYWNETLSDMNKTYTTQQGFDDLKSQAINDSEKSIDYTNKSLYYEQEMVKYAPDDVHKKYAEALLKYNQKALEKMKLLKEYINLLTYKGFSDTTRANEISKQLDDINKELETLNNQKDQIKLQNSNLNEQIDRLSQEAEKAIN
nr:hypothetical protein [uncultured Methanobacterium sp.]